MNAETSMSLSSARRSWRDCHAGGVSTSGWREEEGRVGGGVLVVEEEVREATRAKVAFLC